MRKFLICLCLAGSIAALESAELYVVPGAYRSGKAYVDCTFDGVERRCFLDTGSAMTLLSAAGKIKAYPNLGRFRFKSASGIVKEAETVQISRVDIDGHPLNHVKIGRVPKEGGESTLGIDLLGSRPFSIEFRDSPILRVAPRPPSALNHTLEVAHHGLMAVPVMVGESSTYGLWDTGASVTAVDKSFAAAHPEYFQRGRTHVRGVDGTGQSIELESVRVKRISIGRRVFRNVPVVTLDLSMLSEERKEKIVAVVGFNLIKQANWYFDRTRRAWDVR